MEENPFTARDGKVFYRGTYQIPEDCERLLAVFRRQAREADWFAPCAAVLASQLAAAMQAAGISQRKAA